MSEQSGIKPTTKKNLNGFNRAKMSGTKHNPGGKNKDSGSQPKYSENIRHGKSYPLHLHISLVYIILIIILLSITGTFNYWQAKKNLALTTQQVFTQINNEIKNKIKHLQDASTEAIAYLYQSPLMESRDLADKMKSVPLMAAILQLHPALSSVAIGYANGDFFRVGRMDYDNRVYSQDPQEAHYIIRSYENSKEKQIFTYLNHNLDIIDQHEENYDGYDPREREWYRQAIVTDKVISTHLYFFAASQRMGKSVAQRNKEKDMVISISFPLTGLDQFLDTVKLSHFSDIIIFDDNKNVLYYSGLDIALKETANDGQGLFKLSELNYPLKDAVIEKLDSDLADEPYTVKLDGKEFIFAMSHLTDSSVGGTTYHVVISSPRSDVLPDLASLIWRQGIFMLLAFIIAVPVSWFFSKRLSRKFISLSEVAKGMRNFSFPDEKIVRSTVSEFNELSLSMFHTNRTLKRFLEINTVISSERNYDKLLDTVLSDSMDTVDAVVGILYLMTHDEKHLIPGAANYIGSACHNASDFSNADFLASMPSIETANKAQTTDLLGAIEGISQIKQVNRESWPADSMRKLFTDLHMQLISVPLISNQKVIGVLCLYRHNEHQHPNRDMLSFVTQLSGGIAVAIENHQLIDEQKKLFDAFIRLLAEAIDSKSRYTGGHCQRVPVIAKMLAVAADATDDEPFKNFHIDENGWESIRVASWLHDCGKIITPEHVVDKATKLETVYNRIHEIRMRFEVLKRDTEIACYRSILQGENKQTAQEKLSAELKQLDDDFEFLAKCNIGNEAMAPEHIQRLNDISRYTWQRTLSDRLGISEAERKRKEINPEADLPVTEYLLADKPEHLIEKEEISWMTPEHHDRLGLKFAPPEHKYNLGELTNLSIIRGTLTEEERYQINNHVVQTIAMLSHLPFPESYGDIVEIAGNHHERMDAKGYPRGLRKEEMSVEARIIAIADVFDALTAADRPYKEAKKLSEALAIMSNMAKNGHLDTDLFNLFIRSGVYRNYATLYLESFQIDTVDEENIYADC